MRYEEKLRRLSAYHSRESRIWNQPFPHRKQCIVNVEGSVGDKRTVDPFASERSYCNDSARLRKLGLRISEHIALQPELGAKVKSIVLTVLYICCYIGLLSLLQSRDSASTPKAPEWACPLAL
ncbi:hypothetical protein CYMTET_35295 [Cymbomonas tetramitiformis]|uniref:Uncharacterized protein n=1 Tax=Cymbomonas tetramitiformis TaxID=36881 RepID=A0AAE0F9I0_9CHLO|nr:hypothetical protein CYMTET_35295 [Cymbomonas tetramitiformis]